ncbi:hypothetical protein DFH08DRAFT_970332 [Mycena albidolilacea]|uniref:Uncharacterized protein n=1 Tax=Mycena albidolilacea TaxID=1033008 RepID=A0AAD7EH66_9AGAR|nr:hypothetical protein DFH08DRAFT_970332 [Mycena albidolilacea]
MAPDAKLRLPADQEYLDSLSGRHLMDFRNYIMLASSSATTGWVDVDLFWDTVVCAASTPEWRRRYILPTFDPGFLDCGGSAGFGTSVPDSGTMFDNPADEFMDLYGFPTFFSDSISTSDFSPFAPSAPLPLLPPPPPDSPPGASPTAEEPASSAPKSRRGPQRQVDEANVMTSTCSRVPSTRKRVADEAPISNRLPQKGKDRQGMH